MYKTQRNGLLTLILTVGMLTLGMFDPAQAQTVEGPTALTETYRDWIVRCASPAAVGEQAAPGQVCEMNQELLHQESGQRVLALALQPVEPGASLTLVAPFGLLLAEGVKIAVDGEAVTVGTFRTCLPGGCVSVIDLDQGALDRFAAGEVATVTMRDASNQEIVLNVSLAGFTSAWKRLKDL